MLPARDLAVPPGQNSDDCGRVDRRRAPCVSGRSRRRRRSRWRRGRPRRGSSARNAGASRPSRRPLSSCHARRSCAISSSRASGATASIASGTTVPSSVATVLLEHQTEAELLEQRRQERVGARGRRRPRRVAPPGRSWRRSPRAARASSWRMCSASAAAVGCRATGARTLAAERRAYRSSSPAWNSTPSSSTVGHDLARVDVHAARLDDLADGRAGRGRGG